MGMLDDEPVTMERREFEGASSFAVEVGTTGEREGNAGGGSRVVLTLQDLAATAWEVDVDGRTTTKPDRVTLSFGGQYEGENIIRALEHAAARLRELWEAEKGA